jgi:hypothetical protein
MGPVVPAFAADESPTRVFVELAGSFIAGANMLIPSLLKATVVAGPMFFSRFTPPPVRPEATRSVASTPAPAAYRSLASQAGMSKTQLDDLRKTLDRTAKLSKRKEKAVEMRRLLLATLEANTQAEYDAIMSVLRAKLAAHKKSRLYGKFLVDVPRPDDRNQKRQSGPAGEECTTEEGGIWYTDECLTEQEKEDNRVWGDALYSETIYDFEEAEDDCYYTSSDPATDCEWASSPSPSPTSQVSSGQGYPSESPFLREGDDGATPCEQLEALEGAGGAVPKDCWGKAYTATAAATLWAASAVNFFGKYANTVWAAARAAGNASRVSLLVGALGVGYFIGSYINCINGWEMLDSPAAFDRAYPTREPLDSFIL